MTEFQLTLARWLAQRSWSFRSKVALSYGRMAARSHHTRRAVVDINLKLCFPQMAERERDRVARLYFALAAKAWVDTVWGWAATPAELRRRVALRNAEFLQVPGRKPFIIYCPHFLGQQLIGQRLSLEGRGALMYLSSGSRALDRAQAAARGRFNHQILIDQDGGLRRTVKHLQAGTPVWIANDIDLGPRHGVWLPFMGVPALTSDTIARLASRLRVEVRPLIASMDGDGYVGTFEQALPPSAFDDPQAGLHALNRLLEQHIRKCPEQYWWSQARFLRRPPGEPSVYPDAVAEAIGDRPAGDAYPDR